MATAKIVRKPRQISPQERQLVKLRRDLMDARKRWEKVVGEACFDRYDLQVSKHELPSKRAQSRRIYFVWMPEVLQRDSWLWEMRKEFDNLGKRVITSGFKEQRAQKGLWCPGLFFNPVQIDLTTYYQRPVEPIKNRAAQAFLDKSSAGTTFAAGDCRIVRPAAKDHRLRVITARGDGGIQEYAFKGVPRWSVCFLHIGADVPKVRRHLVKPNKGMQAPKTCSRGKRTGYDMTVPR